MHTPTANTNPLERLGHWERGDGDAFWFLGTLVTFKANSARTGGAFTLIEQLAPPGFSPPLHVHHVEDEVFYVLDGALRIRCGDRDLHLDAGGSVFLPKDVPHSFRVEGGEPARLLQLTAPGGFDRFVEAAGVPAGTRTLPPPSPPPPGTIERIAALGEAHGFTIVGPPLSVD